MEPGAEAVDAAIETFRSDSPVGWWVAIVVAIYLVGSAAIWWFRNVLWERVEGGLRQPSLSLFSSASSRSPSGYPAGSLMGGSLMG